MKSRFTQATLILSEFGDSIEIKVFSKNATEENIHPLLKKGLTCHGYDQILSFLKEIQANLECLQVTHLAHQNNHLYPGHIFYPPKSPIHEESIEKMIAFVEERMRNPAIPQESYLNRIGTNVVNSAIKSGCKII